MGLVTVISAVSVALAACTDEYVDPYLDAPPLRTSDAVLGDINLAAAGLRAYDCDLFDAALARCYDALTWGSVRAGRETMAQLHREMLASGASA